MEKFRVKYRGFPGRAGLYSNPGKIAKAFYLIPLSQTAG